jgi:hypothetical protein
MKKTPTIFERDWNGDRSRVVNIPNEKCAWVFSGEGWPTKKIDGTCCLVRDGKLYKRRELKPNDKAPDNFEVADHDDETGKTIGWVPVSEDDPADRWHIEAFSAASSLPDGTYELVGPKIQGNPEKHDKHELVSHNNLRINEDVPRDFDGLKDWLDGKDIEGLVFHHADGRMGKIKLRDFGIKRK